MLTTLLRALPTPAERPPHRHDPPTDRALHALAPGWTAPGGLSGGILQHCTAERHHCGGDHGPRP